METRLVISTVSEKYGHVSSLGIRASLFIFIITRTASFFTLLLHLCFCYPLVAACLLCSGMVVDSDRDRKRNTTIFYRC